MADFQLEDIFGGGDSSPSKKKKQKKAFLIACIVVGIVALIMWYVRERGSGSTGTDYYEDGSAAIGYGGYPTTGGGYDETNMDYYYQSMETMRDLYDQSLETQDEKWQNLLDQQEDKYNQLLDKYDNSIANMEDKYLNMLDKLDSADNDYGSSYSYRGSMPSASDEIDTQALIEQMQENSHLYNVVDDRATKDYLHDENSRLAEQLGLTFDSKSGYWLDSSGRKAYSVYNTPTETKTTPVTGTGSKTPSTGRVTYQNNVDYQSKINNAIRTGQSAATINALNEQRNAKIAATGNTKANVTYDKNTDYQALINQAKAAGASQSVIDNLNAQRNAKIAGENLNKDGTKKTAAKTTTTVVKPNANKNNLYQTK